MKTKIIEINGMEKTVNVYSSLEEYTRHYGINLRESGGSILIENVNQRK